MGHLETVKIALLKGEKGDTGYPTDEEVQAFIQKFIEDNPDVTINEPVITKVVNSWLESHNVLEEIANMATKEELQQAKESLETKNAEQDSAISNNYNKAVYVENQLSTKQDTLVSGQNIKTINNQDIIGNGNIQIDSLFSPDFQNLIYSYTTVAYTTINYTAVQDCFLFGGSISGLILTDTNGQVINLGKWENRYGNIGYSLPYLVRKGQKLELYHHYGDYLVQIYGVKYGG